MNKDQVNCRDELLLLKKIIVVGAVEYVCPKSVSVSE